MGSSNSVSPSNKQHEQSQQAASDKSLTTFKAATAAFNTNELLHLIIAEVPPEYRIPLLRVSKTWQAAVVKLGYAIERVEGGHDAFHQCTSVPVYYLPEKTLKCNESNPVLGCYTKSV
jgi:hypothetical protein